MSSTSPRERRGVGGGTSSIDGASPTRIRAWGRVVIDQRGDDLMTGRKLGDAGEWARSQARHGGVEQDRRQRFAAYQRSHRRVVVGRQDQDPRGVGGLRYACTGGAPPRRCARYRLDRFRPPLPARWKGCLRQLRMRPSTNAIRRDKTCRRAAAIRSAWTLPQVVRVIHQGSRRGGRARCPLFRATGVSIDSQSGGAPNGSRSVRRARMASARRRWPSVTNRIGVKSMDARCFGLFGLGKRSTLAVQPAAAIATRRWSNTVPQLSSASRPDRSVDLRTRSGSPNNSSGAAFSYPAPRLAVVQ